MEKIHVTTTGENQVITILEGEALTPREKRKTGIIGQIDAPKLFFEKRKGDLNPKVSHVLVDRSKAIITLTCDETDQLGTEIEGRANTSKELESLCLGKEMAPSDMSKMLKKITHLFDSRSEAMKLVSELKNFTANLSTSIEKKDDNRGGTKNLIETAVKTDIPVTFDVNIPLLSGAEKKKMKVEICLSARGSQVEAWLEIEGLSGSLQDEIDNALAENTAIFIEHDWTVMYV